MASLVKVMAHLRGEIKSGNECGTWVQNAGIYSVKSYSTIRALQGASHP